MVHRGLSEGRGTVERGLDPQCTTFPQLLFRNTVNVRGLETCDPFIIGDYWSLVLRLGILGAGTQGIQQTQGFIFFGD